jgi:hypothetical protein
MVTINIDISKAREIYKNRLREVRGNLFPALDIEFQRSFESGVGKDEIAAKKQAFRDVTKDTRINSASSIDELKSLWPVDLFGPY